MGQVQVGQGWEVEVGEVRVWEVKMRQVRVREVKMWQVRPRGVPRRPLLVAPMVVVLCAVAPWPVLLSCLLARSLLLTRVPLHLASCHRHRRHRHFVRMWKRIACHRATTIFRVVFIIKRGGRGGGGPPAI